MTKKFTLRSRIVSTLLTIALLLSMIPFVVMTGTAAGTNTVLKADPSSMMYWRNLFPTTGELSTENAGGVWMDKSVFTDASAFQSLGITKDRTDSFLVALSSIASNMNITGMSSVPSDSMLILDVSGSMNDGDNDVCEELVEAANQSIHTLLSSNKHNRVGVVLYSGSSGSSTNYTTAAMLLLPLGRYATGADNEYLTYTVEGRRETTETIGIDRDVTYEGTTNKPTSLSKEVVGATYIQRGILTALNEFIERGDAGIVEDPALGTIKRKPVVVLMSDGAPSLGSTNFTDPGKNDRNGYNLGSGSGTSAALGFVTQLTAAYAKAKIEEKYQTDALFYTLGLGLSANDSVAISVMDPDNKNASTAVDDFWNLNREAWLFWSAFKGYNHVNVGESVSLGDGASVTKIDTPLDQHYVDRYFSASTTDLVEVFGEVMSTIQLQSAYFPTLISQSEELSGYISFVDRIGEYMHVADMKGIVIGNKLFSGADLASNFVPDGGELGSLENPTVLGKEFVASVRARLGIADDDTARTLISLAYQNGQLSYTDENHYSNYIGWYANAAGEFLGFYNEGTTVLPAPTGDAKTDPAFVVRSYDYLGEVDESHGVSESDMMYATVQVRKNIATEEELVTFAIPAALIPLVTYDVTLDEAGELSDLTVSGATSPICLLYEVALDEDITPYNVKELLSSDYLADPHNVNSDGTVNFYASKWDHTNATQYGTVNTYSYFNPSRQNDKYYYLEDTPIYTDTNGTLYRGTTRPDENGTYYRSYTVYKNNGRLRTETLYRELSDAVKATAQPKGDGTWYVPKGDVHVNLDGYTLSKGQQNYSGTLSDYNVPFVDTARHEINEAGFEFYVGAVHGNNGKLTLTPETGIKLSKTMAEGVAAPTGTFAFELYNTTDPNDNTTYPARLLRTDGTEVDVSVSFNGGQARVELKAGESIYIGGMTPSDTFRIVEEETAAYYVSSVTGLNASDAVTVEAQEIKAVSFVNDERGVGDLTIAKEVTHDFGQEYGIAATKTFTIEVTLSGIGTENHEFRAAHSGDPTVDRVTTVDGRFTVTLKHDEQFEIFDLPAGTVATVTEVNLTSIPGFTPSYWENGVLGDGRVTVVKDDVAEVIVVNDYQPGKVDPINVTVSGSKTLTGRDWLSTDRFIFELQRYDGINAATGEALWTRLGDQATATSANRTFTFTNAFARETFDVVGTYYYRVVEIEPAQPIGGVSYDKTVHSFSVNVGDADMDGKLEITSVVPSRETTVVTLTADGWNVNTSFTNVYSTTGSATATIDLNKLVANNGGAPKSSAGYRFGLYDESESTLLFTSPTTTDRGFARLVLTYTATGTYRYVLKEIVPDPIPNGWTYSTVKIPVTVVVSDNGNGVITSAVIYAGDTPPANVGSSISATFTNTYDPTDTTLEIDFVKKQLDGRAFSSNDRFTFTLTELNVPAGKTPQILNGVSGSDTDGDGIVDVTFNGVLTFDSVGTYAFEIRETGNDANGIVNDKTVYHVHVTVTDTDGQLSASYQLVTVVGDTVVFKNTYKASPVTHTIVGNKTLIGRTLLNDEFSFLLTELSYNGSTIDSPRSWTVKNLALDTDNIVFPTLTYEKAGTYVYRVTEVIPDSGRVYGVNYDSRAYTVTVVVTDNGLGALEVTSETVGGAGTVLQFRNEYKADSTFVQITGDKVLVGKEDNTLNGGEFEFELYESNVDWDKIGAPKQTVENGAGGVIAFEDVDFDTAGNRYFIVVEKNGGETIDGMTYDDAEYRVWVEVKDDLKGKLHATIHLYDDEGIPQERISFVNTYEAEEPVVPPLGDNTDLWTVLAVVSLVTVLSLGAYDNRKKRLENA